MGSINTRMRGGGWREGRVRRGTPSDGRVSGAALGALRRQVSAILPANGVERHCAKAHGHAEHRRVIFVQGCSICIQTSRGTGICSPLGISTSSPPSSPPLPHRPQSADGCACARPHHSLQGIGAHERRRGPDVQNLQGRRPGVSSGAWPRPCRRDELRPYMREKRASRGVGAAL